MIDFIIATYEACIKATAIIAFAIGLCHFTYAVYAELLHMLGLRLWTGKRVLFDARLNLFPSTIEKRLYKSIIYLLASVFLINNCIDFSWLL